MGIVREFHGIGRRVGIVFGCLTAVACSSQDSDAPPMGTVIAGAVGAAGAGAGSGAADGNVGGFGALGGAGGVGGLGAMAGVAGSGPVAGAGPASVLQYHNHSNRDGLYVDAAFTRVASAMIRKDPSFMAAIKGPTYAQPLYFENPEGNDLLITATEQNEVSAFSPSSGMPVWQKTLAEPGEPGCGGNIRPLGITGTPVIDAATRTLYVAAMTKGAQHKIFALSLVDGSTLPGWPVDVNTVKAGPVAFNSATQHQRGALLIVGKTLYVPYGGHFQDCGDYHGWVVGVPLDNPSAPLGFATQGFGGGIWAPGGLSSDGTSIFASTGNTMAEPGAINTTPSTWAHGNAVLRLSPTLTTIGEAQTADFFATENWKAQDMEGLDLGGSSPVLFSLPGAEPSELALALGKSGEAYLLNRIDLGGMGGELQLTALSGGSIAGGMIQATAVYPTPSGMFAAFRSAQPVMDCKTGSGNYGTLKVSAGSPPTMSVEWCSTGNGSGSPIVTSPDGMTDSVVWYFAGGRLMGWNGETGTEVYSDPDSLGTIDKFQTPIVAKGRMFIASSNAVHAFTVK
jgi:hypothetical protein